MNSSESEGLGLSLLIYMAAIVGALAMMALPVYLANRPQIYDNPLLVRADPVMNGPIVGKRVSARVPLARLRREILVNPAIVAALNAKTVAAPEHHPTQHMIRRTYETPMTELQSERKRPRFFLFDLFRG